MTTEASWIDLLGGTVLCTLSIVGLGLLISAVLHWLSGTEIKWFDRRQR